MEPVLERALVDEAGVEVVLGLLLELGLGDRSVAAAVPVAVLLGGALRRGDELGEHARERVDLVPAKLGARRRVGRSSVSTRSRPSIRP